MPPATASTTVLSMMIPPTQPKQQQQQKQQRSPRNKNSPAYGSVTSARSINSSNNSMMTSIRSALSTVDEQVHRCSGDSKRSSKKSLHSSRVTSRSGEEQWGPSHSLDSDDCTSPSLRPNQNLRVVTPESETPSLFQEPTPVPTPTENTKNSESTREETLSNLSQEPTGDGGAGVSPSQGGDTSRTKPSTFERALESAAAALGGLMSSASTQFSSATLPQKTSAGRKPTQSKWRMLIEQPCSQCHGSPSRNSIIDVEKEQDMETLQELQKQRSPQHVQTHQDIQERNIEKKISLKHQGRQRMSHSSELSFQKSSSALPLTGSSESDIIVQGVLQKRLMEKEKKSKKVAVFQTDEGCHKGLGIAPMQPPDSRGEVDATGHLVTSSSSRSSEGRRRHKQSEKLKEHQGNQQKSSLSHYISPRGAQSQFQDDDGWYESQAKVPLQNQDEDEEGEQDDCDALRAAKAAAKAVKAAAMNQTFQQSLLQNNDADKRWGGIPLTGSSEGRPGTSKDSASAAFGVPFETVVVNRSEAMDFARSISELTMRSSYAEATAKLTDSRRMAYYAVGKHHDKVNRTNGRGRGGNRRCYFTGKLILNGAPFYAGSVQQGLRTLVVFCLPSAVGLPRMEMLERDRSMVSEKDGSLASEKDRSLASFKNTGDSAKLPWRRMPSRSSTKMDGNNNQISTSTRTLSTVGGASRGGTQNPGASVASTVDDTTLSMGETIDPNARYDRDLLLRVLPEPDQDLLDEMKTRYPDQFETLPLQVRSPNCWKLYVKFCFFSGLPIAEGEMHYKVRDEIAREVYGEEIVLSYDVMEAVNGEQSAEILRLPNQKLFRYLRKHYTQQSGKLSDVVFQRNSWELVRAEI